MPKISVLLPCYNAAETIEETLQSLAAQTLQDFEVIMIDDGSTDRTPGILTHWAGKDPRFKFKLRPHTGIIPALNHGLALCQSEYIARMDADDLAHPERFAQQAAYLNSHPNVSLVSSFVSIFPKDSLQKGFKLYAEWLNNLVTHTEICREIFVESPFAHPSVTYRKQAVLSLGGYQDNGWAEDYDLWLRMYLAGMAFAKIPQVLLDWRESPGRLTRTDSRYSQNSFLRAKAHYLAKGPLTSRDGILIWGAGPIGRKLSQLLAEKGFTITTYIDIDPKKIGRTHHNSPIISPDRLMEYWGEFQTPVILTAVGVRGARALIRKRLIGLGFIEGQDWWAAA